MKKLTVVVTSIIISFGAFAQVDSTKSEKALRSGVNDTIRIGNILIIKKGGKKSAGHDSLAVMANTTPRKKSRVTTNWGIVDIGFSNYVDKTSYANATSDGYLVNRPGYPALSNDDFKLRSGKSINVNIWFFMQQLNLVKENISLKYGLGLELNNYRYRSGISYKENGLIPYTSNQTNKPFIFRDSVGFSKNKLAADYLTIPVMLNFASNKQHNNKQFNLALGVSGGYLYSQRNKQRSESRGKEKNKGDYDLEKFRFSYIGEIGYGPLRFYASYSPKSIYEHSLDMRPYNFGFRLSSQ